MISVYMYGTLAYIAPVSLSPWYISPTHADVAFHKKGAPDRPSGAHENYLWLRHQSPAGRSRSRGISLRSRDLGRMTYM